MIHLRRTLPVLVALSSSSALADTTPQTLPFSQDWTDTTLIATDNDWSGVPGVIGYRGDGLAAGNDVDARTVVAESTVVNVMADETDPAGQGTGGIAEFQIADPVIALQGSGTADAPHIVVTLDTQGATGIRITYNVRDIDDASDVVQQVALQYRIGTTGDFTDVPAGYLADATDATATLVTAVDVTLPAAVDNQAIVQIRILTTNATGNDEWVGIDSISVTATSMAPHATGTATPSSGERGAAILLEATVAPGTGPASTGILVRCDLLAIDIAMIADLVDDGTNGDVTAGDSVYSRTVTVGSMASVGPAELTCMLNDVQSRSSIFTMTFTVLPTCGDGAIEGAETCDDGNTLDGDGCDAVCLLTPGWNCSGEPTVCTDIDECADMTSNCDALAICTNVPGSFTCACPMGYDGDGVTTGTGCTDIDECADTTTCDENASCTNGDGDFTCACNAGYDGDGMTCADVDECADGTDNCDENATCANTDGSFTCACAAGYAGDGTTCMPDCGDGIVTSPEACDDGDMTDGDGCDANCAVETGYTCTGEPSTCTPDDDGSGSGNGNNGGEDDGGGCCSSSSHPGSAILLALFVMVGVRRRQRR